MSALSFSLASPEVGRARMRERLEQGVFGAASAILSICLFAGWLDLRSFPTPCGTDVNLVIGHTPSGFYAPDALVFNVTARGEFVANGTWVPDGSLPDFVREALAEKPDRIFMLRADRTLPFREVKSALQVFDVLGARKVYLVTDYDNDPLLKLFSEPWSTNRERI